MQISISRCNGPVTDVEVSTDIEPGQLDFVKDILGMVNKASGDKEDWYVKVGDEIIVPLAEVRAIHTRLMDSLGERPPAPVPGPVDPSIPF